MAGVAGPWVRRGIIAVILPLLVGGCAGRDPGKVKDPLKLRNVSITMEADANGNRPARVELVRVRDVRLVPELVGIEVDDWFGDAGVAFRSANPKALYNRWEPVPGLGSGPDRVKVRGRFAGVLFCQTRDTQPPLRVERDGDLTLLVDDSGCTIADGDRGESFFTRLRRSMKVDLSFEMPARANGNRPLEVDLVRVRDAELVAALARLPGSAWFGEGGRTFRREHPNAVVDHWELVPGDAYGPYPLTVDWSVPGVLFCGSTVRPPLHVEWRPTVEVEVDSGGCRLAARGGSRRWWDPRTWGG